MGLALLSSLAEDGGDGLVAVVELELAVDAVDVVLDRLGFDDKGGSDTGVGVALDDE